MLGNDIVDLQLAAKQSNWQRKGYLQKIFTLQEQELIANATDQDQMVWLLWSMKEAAYKIVSIEIGERFYSPKSFDCFLDLSQFSAKGHVIFERYIFNTASEITKSYISTTATSENNRHIKSYLFPNSTSYINEFNKFSLLFLLTKNEVNLPTIQDMLTQEFCPASVSHHGRYVSIVHPIQFEPV